MSVKSVGLENLGRSALLDNTILHALFHGCCCCCFCNNNTNFKFPPCIIQASKQYRFILSVQQNCCFLYSFFFSVWLEFLEIYRWGKIYKLLKLLVPELCSYMVHLCCISRRPSRWVRVLYLDVAFTNKITCEMIELLPTPESPKIDKVRH